MKTEKERRVYYQDIVYRVCDSLDAFDGNVHDSGLVCGTADDPRTQVQDRLDQILSELEQIRILVDGLRKTADGVPYASYGDKRTFYAVWRDDFDDDEWKLSACRVPRDSDEICHGFDWIVDGAHDECELYEIYSTREAAEVVLAELQKGEIDG